MEFSDSITSILHPITVHFPVALTITALLLAIICWFRTHSDYMNFTVRLLVILAAISAWVAVTTGSFTPHFSGEAGQVRSIHHIYANLTAWLLSCSALIYLVRWIYKGEMPRWLAFFAFIALAAAAVTVGIAGYYGGYIVYNILL